MFLKIKMLKMFDFRIDKSIDFPNQLKYLFVWKILSDFCINCLNSVLTYYFNDSCIKSLHS